MGFCWFCCLWNSKLVSQWETAPEMEHLTALKQGWLFSKYNLRYDFRGCQFWSQVKLGRKLGIHWGYKMSFSRAMPQFSCSQQEDWHSELIIEVTAMPSVCVWHVLVGWLVGPLSHHPVVTWEIGNSIAPPHWRIDIAAKSVGDRFLIAAWIDFKWSPVFAILTTR